MKLRNVSNKLPPSRIPGHKYRKILHYTIILKPFMTNIEIYLGRYLVNN